MFHAIQLWLGSQPLAPLVRDTVWIKALLESLHILADGLLLFSAAVICSRLMGLTSQSTPAAVIIRRYAPWIWSSLATAAVTGTILLTGAGRRGLDNPMFKVKLTAMIVAAAATAWIQFAAMRSPAPSSVPQPQRIAARLTGLVCILCWLATVFAGRLLAYSNAFFPQN
jgi:uncharacterized membrane protein